jgi:hypothetical protein
MTKHDPGWSLLHSVTRYDPRDHYLRRYDKARSRVIAASHELRGMIHRIITWHDTTKHDPRRTLLFELLVWSTRSLPYTSWRCMVHTTWSRICTNHECILLHHPDKMGHLFYLCPTLFQRFRQRGATVDTPFCPDIFRQSHQAQNSYEIYDMKIAKLQHDFSNKMKSCIYACICVCMIVCMCESIYMCLDASMHICIYEFMHVCICEQWMYVYICVYVGIYDIK